MKWFKFLAAAALSMAVSACAVQSASQDTIKEFDSTPAAYQSAVKSVDWNAAKVIDITLFDNHFTPMLLNLKKGAPYVLRITNKEPGTRLVVGSDFLDSLAIHSVSGAEEITETSVVRSLSLQPQQPRVIKAIPMKSGRFEFRRAGHLHMATLAGVFEPFSFLHTEAYGVAIID